MGGTKGSYLLCMSLNETILLENCRGEPKVRLVLIFDSNITLTTYNI